MTVALSPGRTRPNFRLVGGAQPLILLPVFVNGDGPFQFILDTGAGTSLLSSDLAKQLGVKVIDSKEGQSAGGKVSVLLARVDSLAVGETSLENLDVGIVDLQHIGKAVGAQIDGDIGYNFLKDFRLTIDYRRSEIQLDDPIRVEDFGRTPQTEIPMRLAGATKPLILIDVYANGRGPFQFAIDTGTSTTAITLELASELAVDGASVGPVMTGGGHVEIKAGNLESLQVGGARLDNLAVIVANFFHMLSTAVDAKLDGIVGYNFLRNYKVMIDYPNQLLALF
jgi:predicted aspartyl protease